MPPKERQKLQPRAPEYFKGPAPYNPGREPEYFKGPAPYNPNRNTPGTGYLLPNTQEPWNAGLQSGDNSGIMAATMANNRTSINPNTWHQSPYFGIGGYDFVEDHAPEYLDYFQDIKDRDTMEREAGFHPYFNPSLIENNPSFGLDYMADIFGGKGRVGFRKGLDDDHYNAYANWGIEF